MAFAEGDAVEGYWPDDDEWLAATVVSVKKTGFKIAWEDGSQSMVPPDYVRAVAAAEAEAEAEAEVEVEQAFEAAASVPAAAPGDDIDIAALLAAAEAAGACDDADSFVAGNKPPSEMHWAKVLKEKPPQTPESIEEEKKRCRPLGLMTSQQAKEMCLQATKKARRR
mmetsp:Transcript_33184/g.50133  ORF Transcript_33184/g.50133 Transcript_33184/m.50133 type:complete len:167 (+) Transcript_33184:65-565(+)|eukprot:CAMPEP_0206452660 /NCGR_PEP_ID=MMETSP0324_2-20121206/20083_1 /ASSEMBLY_ACC=CAM_ASM_000836 /TAXON_ID=2866 /ORGANISM="Crypthecodinium cohnii, Strain Seligo" /LENGTH=166 /DNA_ID=CAMNT_0053922803 /DNA_START=49 /DNA_END=549 /DNA_ORIENTATION=-